MLVFFDRRMDGYFLLRPAWCWKRLHAHLGHTSTRSHNHLDYRWMSAAICATCVRSFCMFGHSFSWMPDVLVDSPV
jgi:hypothetical protein